MKLFSIHFRVKMTQNNIFCKNYQNHLKSYLSLSQHIGRNENASLDITIMQKAKKHGNSEYQ